MGLCVKSSCKLISWYIHVLSIMSMSLDVRKCCGNFVKHTVFNFIKSVNSSKHHWKANHTIFNFIWCVIDSKHYWSASCGMHKNNTKTINTLRPRQNGRSFVDVISYSFSLMNIAVFVFKLHCYLFRSQWSNGLGFMQATSYYLNQWGPMLLTKMHICIARSDIEN